MLKIQDIRLANEVKVILTDVDDTVAEAFCEVSQEMVAALEQLLERKMIIFFISGQSFDNVYSRVIQKISEKWYEQIAVSPCNGAEIYRFIKGKGWIREYSILDEQVKMGELSVVADFIIQRFQLCSIPAHTMEVFRANSRGNPCEVMVGNRGVQIAFDFVNGIEPKLFGLSFVQEKGQVDDIRPLIAREANQFAKENGYHVVAHVAGPYAIDLVFDGVNKGLPIQKKISFGESLSCKIEQGIVLQNCKEIEVWGDSFENANGDIQMSLALPPEVRTISFRKLSKENRLATYNIVEWNGQYSCNLGLLEYLVKSQE